MSAQFDVATRNGWLSQLTTILGATATLTIYSGAPPANCAAGASGTLLATETLSNPPFAAPSGGSMAMNGLPLTVNAAASGLAGYYRLIDSSAVCREQGTVGQGTGDISFDNATFVGGQAVNLAGFTITAPGA